MVEHIAGVPTSYLIAFITVLGLAIGSFLNVVSYRLPLQLQASWRRDAREFLGLEQEKGRTINIMLPGSHCPKCDNPVKPWHNIPVLSYLLLRGRCAHCNVRISLEYPFVETLTAVLSVVVVITLGATTAGLLGLVFTWALLSLALIDSKTQYLPDVITLPLMWLGLIINTQGIYVDLQDALIGAVVGYLSLWLLYWAVKLMSGKDGFGHGDFKMVAALGAWVGWQALPFVLLVSCATGALVGLLSILAFGRSRHEPMAFGPFLAVGGWVALVFGTMGL